MEVYGIPLCSVHGAESAAGAREALYQDAADELEALAESAGNVPGANLAIAATLKREHHRTLTATIETAERADELLTAAFPDPPSEAMRVDDVAHHYAGLDGSETDFADDMRRYRHNVYALMRDAY